MQSNEDFTAIGVKIKPIPSFSVKKSKQKMSSDLW